LSIGEEEVCYQFFFNRFVIRKAFNLKFLNKKRTQFLLYTIFRLWVQAREQKETWWIIPIKQLNNYSVLPDPRSAGGSVWSWSTDLQF
jgi:hypothetical protein